MSLAPLRNALREALESGAQDGQDGAHDLAHADRVWLNARTIAHGEGLAPSRILLCAAYLHDLVTLPKDHPKRARAASMSATAAGPVMQALGLTPTEIAQARHAIESHSWSGGTAPASPEARILRDADRLEALGAIGIARCFAVSGALGRQLFDARDPFAKERQPDDAAFALDHFAVKLLKLPETFLTPTGRRLAEERAAAMRRYLIDLARELGSPEPDW
ncbi:hypothetical protein DEA8626_02776 [Defluviimonas aquaemixtae]|uniref:HD domain-containing protein n=1 Tax=Albidovulum aquaemixtae TaxID=1542388 RepID=A0A2R8BK91_9RHOB|nr:HD domain-containing protein [Defluviimonas aquaemixtae]SPH23710.1 hypothetical protein DEA8626_02776 [Defluviimonas aquaemixtae]